MMGNVRGLNGVRHAVLLLLVLSGQPGAVALDAVIKDHSFTPKQLSRWKAGTKDPIWSTHIDRRYMRETVFPEIGRLAGKSGAVLEVGYMPFNAHDHVFARVDPRQYYFVDPNPRNDFVNSSGTLLHGKMVDLLPKQRHQFAVIIDYGVVGYKLSELVDKEPQSVQAHLRAYHQLLTTEGTLFLKVDTGQGKDLDGKLGSSRSTASRNIFYWKASVELLSRFMLELVSMEAQYSANTCPDMLVTALANATSGQLRAVAPARANSCESYLYSRWKVKHQWRE